MADESLIGKELDEVRFPVERGKVRELVGAILDDDPLYRDAGGACFDAIPAPLNFPVLAMHWRDQDRMLEELDLDLERVLHGEVSWEYLGPVSVGDELIGRRRVADVTTREGKRGGTMTLVQIELELTNQRGELVARQTDTLIETGG